ncbi:hypothetical protein QOZ91_002378 [Clostridium sardiniense]|nr:hypothetical protein [Clostridium sardiniense]
MLKVFLKRLFKSRNMSKREKKVFLQTITIEK